MLFCTFLADNSFHHPPANFNTFENVGNDDTMPSEGSATEAKMSAESRTLARESPIRPMYFEARITRISYTLGRSCDPLDATNYFWPSAAAASSNLRPILVSSAEKGKIILSGDKLNSDVHNSTAHFCYNT